MTTVKGTAKVDKFTVNASNVIVVTGKKSSTKKISKNGKNRIYGAAAKDTFTVKGGKLNYIYGDAGNETIIVTSKIGTGNRIYGDDAKNKVSGNDTFNINGGSKNYFYGGKGVDTFNVNGGTTNYIYGGEGNDVIVIGKNSKGTAIVKDFSVKSGNKDTVKVTGGAVKSIAASSKNNMVVKGGKSASVALEGAKSKTFTVTDTLGSYTVSGANVKLALGKNYKGTLNTASFITTINARSNANAITINGNAKNNTIYGGAGNNTLNGGAGNDTLSGGAGTDTFVYANGQGKDTITDYTTGQDALQISSGSISKTALANSGKDLVFTVGSGSITLQNAATKSVSLKDSRGSYTVSDSIITLGKDFTGDMDANTYLSSVTTIDGRKAEGRVNITTSNSRDNTVYAGNSGGIIKCSSINATIYNGAGEDTFVYSYGNDTIMGFDANDDNIIISSGRLDGINISNGRDVVFSICSPTNAIGHITVKNGADHKIRYRESDSDEDKYVELYEGKYILGTNQSDHLYGGKGNDKLNGIGENDYLYGGAGDDTLLGGYGQDYLYGEDGNDTLLGEEGNDYLYGGTGNDILIGGNGTDVFVYTSGNDTIRDYDGNSGVDIISFKEYSLLGYSISDNDVIFNISNGGTITICDAAGQRIRYRDINNSEDQYLNT